MLTCPQHCRVSVYASGHGPALCCMSAEVKSTERNKLVYRCQVFGGKGCGKSSFVRGLLGKKSSQVSTDLEEGEAVAIRAVTLPNSTASVYLVVCTSGTGTATPHLTTHFPTAAGDSLGGGRPIGCDSSRSWGSGTV